MKSTYAKLVDSFLLATIFVASRAALPVSAAESVLLPGTRAYPESVTSTSDGTFFVSNLAEGGVLRIKAGKSTQWIEPGTFGTRSTYGVLADEKAGILWVCSNDLSQYGLTHVGDAASALKGFDLKSRVGRVSAMLGPGPSECNDIAVGADGAVYVTDTKQPRVMRLAAGGRDLEVWVSDPRLHHKDGGLDGIAFGADGGLYVNTFGGSDLFRISVESGRAGAITRLQTSRPIVRADGMRHWRDNRFLMVVGGGILYEVAVHGEQAELTVLSDQLDEPTGVTLSGSTAWVSEGRFSLLKKEQPTSLTFHLRSVDLSRP